MKDIEYKEYKKYKEEEILNLYSSNGWSNYTNNRAMLESAFGSSLFILGAYDRDQLVGLIRVVGDGHSIIYIQDILVLPEYQRQSVGSTLFKMVLEQYKDVYQKILLTENTPKTMAFYKSVGFTPDNELGLVSFCSFGL